MVDGEYDGCCSGNWYLVVIDSELFDVALLKLLSEILLTFDTELLLLLLMMSVSPPASTD